MRVADIVRDIKNNSSNFINDHKFVKGNFSWQDGCGAFSYSHSQIDKVYKYILKQEKHHKKRIAQYYLLIFPVLTGNSYRSSITASSESSE